VLQLLCTSTRNELSTCSSTVLSPARIDVLPFDVAMVIRVQPAMSWYFMVNNEAFVSSCHESSSSLLVLGMLRTELSCLGLAALDTYLKSSISMFVVGVARRLNINSNIHCVLLRSKFCRVGFHRYYVSATQANCGNISLSSPACLPVTRHHPTTSTTTKIDYHLGNSHDIVSPLAIHRLPNKYLQYGVSTLHTMHISCWDQVSHWILAVERSPTRMLETSTNSNPLCAITRHNGFKGEYISNKLGSEHVNSPMCMPTDPLNVSINLLQRFDGLLVQMLSFERLDRHLRTTMLDKRYASGVLLCRVAHLKTSGTAFSCQQITQSSTLVIRCFYFIQLQRVNNLSIRAIMHDNRCLELLYWIQRENFIG
jgi:hypothetical protein